MSVRNYAIPVKHPFASIKQTQTLTFYNFCSVINVEAIYYVQQKPVAQFPSDHGMGAVSEESLGVFWSVALM